MKTGYIRILAAGLVLLFLVMSLSASNNEKTMIGQKKALKPSGQVLQKLRTIESYHQKVVVDKKKQKQEFKEEFDRSLQFKKMKSLQEAITNSGKTDRTRRIAPGIRAGSETDGTHYFDAEPQNLNFLVNGETEDTLTVGDEAVFTFNFPEGTDYAELTPIWDANGNGVVDSGDIYIEAIELTDNDENDGDPVTGSYSMLLGDDSEGLNRIAESFVYELYSQGVTEYTSILWEPLESQFSVSGNITLGADNSPLPGIVVFAGSEESDAPWIDITDSTGNYFIAVPDSMDYFLGSFDYLEVTDGLIPDPSHYEIYIDGALTGYDFVYVEPASNIYGYVLDNYGSPLVDVEVDAEMEDGPDFYSITDNNGYFRIPVPEGTFKVGVLEDDLIPAYMVPNRQMVEVGEMDSVQVDFTVFPGNSTISGSVYLNGSPASGISIFAHHNAPPEDGNYGETYTESDENGFYFLYVHYGDGPEPAGYFVHAFDLPDYVIQEEWLDNIPAGAENVDIHLLEVSGGLWGYFINSETGDTLYDMVGIAAQGIDNDYYFNAWPDWDTGEYHLYLPNGTYEIMAGGEGFYPIMGDTVTIADQLLQYDVYLDPISLDGAIYGTITDCDNQEPIPDAYINVWNNNWWSSTLTDSAGFFWIDVPNGFYSIWIEAPDHQGVYDSVDVNYNEVEVNYCLPPFIINGSFYGAVYDSSSGQPIEFAGVSVHGENGDFFQMTDNTGEFYFELASGHYYVDVSAEGYYGVYDEIDIVENDVQRNYFLNPIEAEAVIYGNVHDSESGDPIPGADLYLTHWGLPISFQQFSDENGDFVFDVPNGCYMLSVYAENYVPSFIDSVCAENDSVWLDIPLVSPDGAVFGHIYDWENGNPLPWAWIGIQNLVNGEWIYDGTDENGYYEVPLMNGEYVIFAGANEYMISEPDTFTIANNQVEIDFYLQYRPPFIPPQILSVEDQPNDQGRWVRLTFDGGTTDGGPYQGWSIWRLRTNGIPPAIPDTGFYDFGLDFIAYIPFHGDDVYSLVVPTLVDSNAYTAESGEFWSTFIISAHLPHNIYEWIDSPPASGYSIDNIFPGVPGNLLATGVDNAVQLTWENVSDDDFGYFAVYRSELSGNYSDEPLAMTVDPQFIDSEITEGVTYYYVVTAVDVNGNEGEPSAEASMTITGIAEEQLIPDDFALHQNYPNPFNPETMIRFDLPEDGYVQLAVYDLRGHLIRVLVDENKTAGYHATIWDGRDAKGSIVPTGVYFYRIQVDDKFSSNGKMLFMK